MAVARFKAKTRGWQCSLAQGHESKLGEIDVFLYKHLELGGNPLESYKVAVLDMGRHRSAWLPVLVSACALAMLFGYVAIFGVTHSHSERLATRLYQLVQFTQFVLIAWFVMRWAWREPLAGMTVVAAQFAAISASLVPLLMLDA